MSAIQNTIVQSGRCTRTWCTLWTFTVNTARRLQILGRYAMACAQQQKIKDAERILGDKDLSGPGAG